MHTPNRKAVALVLLVIVAIAAWSKLRFMDPEDHAPLRWRADEYPGAQR